MRRVGVERGDVQGGDAAQTAERERRGVPEPVGFVRDERVDRRAVVRHEAYDDAFELRTAEIVRFVCDELDAVAARPADEFERAAADRRGVERCENQAAGSRKRERRQDPALRFK